MLRRRASGFRSRSWLYFISAVGLILNSVASFPEIAFAQKKVNPSEAVGWGTHLFSQCLKVKFPEISLSGDGRTAFDPSSKRNFAREGDTWIDVKTGEVVCPDKKVASSGWGRFLWGCLKARFPEISLSGDGRTAFDPSSKRNFARNGETWIDVKSGEIVCPQLKPSTAGNPPPAAPVKTALSPKLNSTSESLLAVHNKIRAEVGTKPLAWDPQLAAAATAYAKRLTGGLPYDHATRAERGNSGENLGMGRLGETPVQMMQVWLREKDNFIPGVFPNVSKTGDWFRVGHYSQMIWGTTSHVGCGSATGAKWEYFVCRYSPKGNQDGKPVLADTLGGFNPGFVVGPARVGLDVNVCSGQGASGAGNDVNKKASTNAVLDSLFKCEESVDTAVQPPELPNKEVFKPEKPKKLEDPL